METISLEGRDGIRLAADVDGEPGAPPVVLWHGGGQTRFAWGTTMRTLASKGWRAYSVDLRGHSQSEWAPDGDYGLDAFVRASDKGGGLTVNIGTGVETSVLELYDVMARITGFREDARFAPERPGELLRSALDPGRAAIHLGWKPWTSLQDGLARTLEWHGAHRA